MQLLPPTFRALLSVVALSCAIPACGSDSGSTSDTASAGGGSAGSAGSAGSPAVHTVGGSGGADAAGSSGSAQAGASGSPSSGAGGLASGGSAGAAAGMGGMGGAAAGNAGSGGTAPNLIWPNETSFANSDPWLSLHHTEIQEMHPRFLVINFANNRKLDDVKARFQTQKEWMQEGSRYHGYSDPNAKPFLNYELAKLVDLSDTGTQTSLSIVDADVDLSQPKRAVAIASLYVDGGTSSGLQETLDNGNTWHSLGASFDGLPATVAVAASQPSRIYASGTAADLTPLISTSADNGATWHSYPLTLEQITVPFLAAVDPKRPEVLYVRAPTAAGTDVLVVSADYGQHFKTIYQAKGGLYAFALSPDGAEVAVGGSNDPLTIASTADYQFHAANAVLPLCLKWSAAGLYACADEAKSGFSLGLSEDFGATFKTLFRKSALTLLSCNASTATGQYCPQAWAGQQAALGIDAGASSAGMPGSGAGESASAGSAASEAGSSGAPGGSANSAKPASKSSSCALSARPGLGEPRPFFWVWLAVGLCSLRLRRERSISRSQEAARPQASRVTS